ncbi:HDOD domain-containing protein [Piscinibacter sakaiensis]|uniref:Putative signal transduction protein n=1 Tax=Piscinibacter sakaiensis TaxID=1547922 RepID=A0A0K8NTM3_PISS1|nr:HDOD domain-containing protein [Piscinibacter sakaiensis]GAP33761.1 putative signal transduction protein [Piscinibacter sakaiensis]
MFDVAILGQVALGYSPFIDRQRNVTATRLTVFALRPDEPLDAGQFLLAIGGVWPAGGARVSLNITSESLLHDLLQAGPTTNVMVEVPAFMAAEPANAEAIRRLHADGSVLLIKGRPLAELPREVLPCFQYSIIDFHDDRRVGDGRSVPPAGVTRSIGHVQAGVRSIAALDESFRRGAAAALGWPLDDLVSGPAAAGRRPGVHTDLQVIIELIHRVDREEPIERLEQTLKRDPTLAFKLLRYINSPAFGFQVEIGSFRHAIMMLGYQRLKRWLALLLATASKDANLQPAMFAAVRRGLLMEELARATSDESMRNEVFICGVFSLLDHLFHEPFKDLLKTIPVPERIHAALVDGEGPYGPYLELVRAIEAESLFDITAASERLMFSPTEINRAVLTALASAAQLG